MFSAQGEWRKMPVQINKEQAVEYEMILYNSQNNKSTRFFINPYIGQSVIIQYEGNILCKKCGKKTKKSYQGFCYSCFTKVPEAAPCIIRPELCEAHIGKGRNLEWEEKHHNKPHLVYLAGSDVIKVGVTNFTQIPTRWIDQGAAQAIKLAETPNRYLAGMIEVALKSTFTDKTNWRKMLTNEIDRSIDLVEAKWELEELLPDDISQYISEDDKVWEIKYPVIEFPKKVKSLQLDKNSFIKGKLLGIKGQYLLLDQSRVLNVRKHEGYQISIQFGS